MISGCALSLSKILLYVFYIQYNITHMIQYIYTILIGITCLIDLYPYTLTHTHICIPILVFIVYFSLFILSICLLKIQIVECSIILICVYGLSVIRIVVLESKTPKILPL